MNHSSHAGDPAQDHAVFALIGRNLAAALLYLLAGGLGTLLSFSSGYASPVWPAIGVAVALLLIWGWRCWPGIWLGGMLIDAGFDLSPSSLLLSSVTAAMTTTQAMFSAWLARRYLQTKLSSVTADGRLVWFLLCAGPLTCLLSAGICVGVIYWGGRIDHSNLLGEWLRWWSGDTLGILLFTPVSLFLWPGKNTFMTLGAGRVRYALPLIITAMLLSSGHVGLAQWQELRARNQHHAMMQMISNNSTRVLAETLLPLTGLAHFFSASEQVTREEFRQYTNHFLNHPAILSVDWAPRIEAASRAAFEAGVRTEGFEEFQITELGQDRRFLPASPRPEYFPILFSEPLLHNRNVLGLDHHADPQRISAMALSRRSQSPIASGLLPLARTDRQATLVFMPVWQLGPARQERQPAGYVVATLDLQQLFSPLLYHARQQGLLSRVIDITPGNRATALINELPDKAQPEWSYTFKFWGREWRLDMQPAAPYWQPGASSEERFFLGFAMLTALLAAFATLSSASRHHYVRLQVAERTAQLRHELEARSAAEAALHMQKEEVRAVLDHLMECVIAIDSKGIIRRVNPAIEPLLGYHADDVLGKNISCLMASPLREQHDQYLARYLETGQRHIIGSSREVTGLHKQGHGVTLELSVSEYHIEGEPFFIGTLRDIRERKAMIASLTQAREQAEQASRAKSAFLATISHEIRTPMNGIMGMVEVLLRDQLTPYQHDLLSTVRESSTNLLTLIDSILDFSKIEAGKLDIDLMPTEVTGLLQEQCRAFTALASAKEVDLQLHLAVETPLWIDTDPLRLRQILTNLMGNAIKFSAREHQATARRGRVEVSVTRTGGDAPRLILEVADNGIGIAAEHLSQLFMPFTQMESSTTRRFGGTGLGLAICKRLTELMAGTIEVESRPAHGSRFRVTLPAPSAAGTPPLPSALVAGSRQAGTEHLILVAEDDEINRKVIQHQLALLGYRCEVTRNGREALEKWRSTAYQLLITDLHMPEMDGYELAAHIRREQPPSSRLPILALTAHAQRDEIDRALATGIDECLIKPVKLDMLQAVLARWLHGAATAPAATVSAPSAATALLDPQILGHMLGHDPLMMAETLEDYMDTLGSLAVKLEETCREGDHPVIVALAHRLTSSSRAVGAQRLASWYLMLEEAARQGDRFKVNRLGTRLPALRQATLQAVKQQLTHIQQAGHEHEDSGD